MLSAFSLCWGLLAGAVQVYFLTSCTSVSLSAEKVLHGLLDITLAEKTSLEEKCQFHWPCAGLTLAPGVFVAC